MSRERETGSRSLHRKIKLSEQWDRRTAYKLSARWKGGLSDGDPVRMGDRNLEVVGRNPETNKLILADTDMVDGDQLKQDAYKQYTPFTS